MIKLYSFLLIIFFSINTFAHQPRLNEEGDYAMSKDDPYIIKDPEISKAIYSTLDGAEHFYKIKSDEDFNMYAGITVAKQDDCPDEFQKFSFSILDENFNTLHAFDGESFKWWSWYEEYGKKWYWVGPEYGAAFKSNKNQPYHKFFFIRFVFGLGVSSEICCYLFFIKSFAIIVF